MSAALLMGSLAVLVTASVTFPFGWWLGQRRQASQVIRLRGELDSTRSRAQSEKERLRQRYEAMLSGFTNMAIDAVRQSYRRAS